MLDGEEEDEPCGERYEVLYHRPHREAQHGLQALQPQLRQAVQSVAAGVEFDTGVDDEVNHRYRLCQYRADGRALYAERGHAAMAENKDIVEHDVARHEHEGVGCEHPRVGGCHIKRAEHDGRKGEEETEYAGVEIVERGGANMFRLQNLAQQPRGARAGEEEEHYGECEQEAEAVVEQMPHGRVVALAVAPRHKDLRPRAEPETYHENGHEEDAADGRRPEFHLAHAPKESGVGEANELLHQCAYQHGVGYVPNLSVCVSRGH